jgi:hypothetical protein
LDWPGCGTAGAGSTDGGLLTGDWLPGTVAGAVPGVVAGAPVAAAAPGAVMGASVVSGIVGAGGAVADGVVVATSPVMFVASFVGAGERPLRATPMMTRPQTMAAIGHGAERVRARTPAQAGRDRGEPRDSGLAAAGTIVVGVAAGALPVPPGAKLLCPTGSTLGTLAADMTCSVHRRPSQYRVECRPDGSLSQLPRRSRLDAGSLQSSGTCVEIR